MTPLTKLKKFVKNYKHKRLVLEQQALSITLLQKLVEIYNQNSENLVITEGLSSPESQSIRATTKDSYFSYQINYNFVTPKHYSITIGNKISTLLFGDCENDGIFFKDEKYNYAAALYNMLKYSKAHRPEPAIDKLMSKQPKPHLKRTNAWPEYRMNVFQNLDKILQK